MAADDGARGLREGDDARRTFERFEAACDLRLLDGEAVGRERVVGFGAELVADAQDPAVEILIARAAGGAALEVRVAASCGPEARERWSSR